MKQTILNWGLFRKLRRIKFCFGSNSKAHLLTNDYEPGTSGEFNYENIGIQVMADHDRALQ